MKLITQRQVIQNVANRWRKQYEPFKDDTPLYFTRNGIRFSKTKKLIADELDALDKETASAKDVNDIIGNESWTRLQCDECGSNVDAVIRVGQEPDYDSSTAHLCMLCVKAVASLLELPKGTPDAT